MTEDKTLEVQMLTRLAEKVMGWRVLSASGFSAGTPEPNTFCYDHDQESAFFRTEFRMSMHWDPKEHIHDAWMLVEALRKREKFVYVTPAKDGYSSVLGDGRNTAGPYFADTAPMAICLAADRAAKRMEMEAADV
jgi:hypothetical protein